MCSEKERLLTLLRLATHELSSLLDQGSRLAGQHPRRTDDVNRVIASARVAHKKSVDEFIAHLLQHGCGTVAEVRAAVAGEK
jgi:hypothetical protein